MSISYSAEETMQPPMRRAGLWSVQEGGVV